MHVKRLVEIDKEMRRSLPRGPLRFSRFGLKTQANPRVKSSKASTGGGEADSERL